MESTTQQSFGAVPTEVRDTNHYQDEYVKSFVEKWDELIDWDHKEDILEWLDTL